MFRLDTGAMPVSPGVRAQSGLSSEFQTSLCYAWVEAALIHSSCLHTPTSPKEYIKVSIILYS